MSTESTQEQSTNRSIMQPNKKRTKPFKPGRVQQRLIDYSIFTGESLALINKHFVLQANGQRPFTQEELYAIDHGIKKNRKRAIESYTKGSVRSEYRPTLKLGYYPEEEDIELRDPDIVSLPCNHCILLVAR